MSPVTLTTGQAVPLPGVPGGLAQIEDLHRTTVSVLYLRGGRLCRRRISAVDVARLLEDQPLLPVMDWNPFDRGVVRRSRTFGR